MKLKVMKLPVTKLHITIGIIAAALTLAVFSACESTFVEKIKSDADLLSLKIGDLLMEGVSIPEPITNRDWVDENYDETDMFDAGYKTIAFKHEEDVIDAWFIATVSRGAKVKWGIANRTVRPNFFYDTRVPATFDGGDYLYFQVTSEDNEITNYYRFATYISSPVKELSSIKVAGREGDMSTVAPADTWDSEKTIGTLHITQAEAENAVIDAVPWAATSKLRYAVTRHSDAAVPEFQESNILSFTDGQRLYVEVTAENSEQYIYCFRVFVGRIATIGTLAFKGKTPAGEDVSFEALGKGTAKNYWSDNSGAGSFDSPHQPAAGYTFSVKLDEPNGKWQYAKITTLPRGTAGTAADPHNNNGQPTWSAAAYASGDSVPDVKFNSGEYLAIKVIPANPQGSVPDYFYKVKVGLLAAEFTVQPKSAVYAKDAPAVPLTFTLDRNIANPTYQWYEANAWYGGYGFDSEGLIGEKGTVIKEPGWGEKDKGTIDDIDYDVTEWYVLALDEKNNVSLHNGGNQYYRLPNPGRPVPMSEGGRNATYTPKTNYRPFITNFSNETHYYWVVVTDPATGLKATSARAVILTEWGVVYKNGSPVLDDDGNPTTVSKEHYLIDLYAYQRTGPDNYGLQASPRNPTPFKDGNHRDKYLIPVTFPKDFDIYDYSVFTAQALFYLADGREWIQNWTQGDIGFARNATDDDGNVISTNPDDAEELVLWYNLTNDNATRGLASSGNEPQGSGLKVTPDYIVVKPAGTKPINQMPPFMADIPANYDSVGRLKPLNNDNAQGWFTPYIELSELRFEGPPREKPVE
jgi:hypothetical protein